MPPVTIQQFNHITIQDILERNQGLLNHIKECQDNGWMEEAKIYQKRLMCNISFLGCLSDALIPQALSTSSKRTSMSSSLYPTLNTNHSANSMKSCTLPISRIEIVDSLPPPIMIKVPEIKEKPEVQNYVPVPPLVGNNYERDISLSKFSLMDPVVSRSVLVSRLGPAFNNESTVSTSTPSARASQRRSVLSSTGPASFLSPLQSSYTNNADKAGNFPSLENLSKPALALFSDLAPEDSDLSDEEYKQPEDDDESQSDDEGYTEENSQNDEDISKTQNQESNVLSNEVLPEQENIAAPQVISNLSNLRPPTIINQNQDLMDFNTQSYINSSTSSQNTNNLSNNFHRNYIYGNNQQSLPQPISNIGQAQNQGISSGQTESCYNMMGGASLIPSASFQQPSMHSFQQQQLLQQQTSFLPQIPSAPLMQHSYPIQQQPSPVLPQMNQLDMLAMQLQALPPEQQLMLIQQLTQRIQPQLSSQEPLQNNSMFDHTNQANGVIGNSPFDQPARVNQPAGDPYSFFERPQSVKAQESSHVVSKDLMMDDFFNFVEDTPLDGKEEMDERGSASSAEFQWDE